MTCKECEELRAKVEYLSGVLAYCENSEVLSHGCGLCSDSEKLAKTKARLTTAWAQWLIVCKAKEPEIDAEVRKMGNILRPGNVR